MGERKRGKGRSHEGHGRARLDDEQEPPQGRDEEVGGKGEAEGDAEDRHELDLEETLDQQRHGSGEYDPEERYGRRDVFPDRENAGPGDEDLPDTAEGEPKRGRSPRKQDPE